MKGAAFVFEAADRIELLQALGDLPARLKLGLGNARDAAFEFGEGRRLLLEKQIFQLVDGIGHVVSSITPARRPSTAAID